APVGDVQQADRRINVETRAPICPAIHSPRWREDFPRHRRAAHDAVHPAVRPAARNAFRVAESRHRARELSSRPTRALSASHGDDPRAHEIDPVRLSHAHVSSQYWSMTSAHNGIAHENYHRGQLAL